jgi:hypothetical protein
MQTEESKPTESERHAASELATGPWALSTSFSICARSRMAAPPELLPLKRRNFDASSWYLLPQGQGGCQNREKAGERGQGS